MTGTSASVLELLLSKSGMQVEITDICGTKNAAVTVESESGLAELDWQHIERSDQ